MRVSLNIKRPKRNARKKSVSVGTNMSVDWLKTMIKVDSTRMLRVKIELKNQSDPSLLMAALSRRIVRCVKSSMIISVACLHGKT